MTYKKIKVPKKGNKISYKDGKILVPDNPIIPFIEGDGIGVDITPADVQWTQYLQVRAVNGSTSDNGNTFTYYPEIRSNRNVINPQTNTIYSTTNNTDTSAHPTTMTFSSPSTQTDNVNALKYYEYDSKISITSNDAPSTLSATQAALLASRKNKRMVTLEDFESAKDKVMMGAERRSMVMSEEEKLKTADHESGHAIVGRSLDGHDPVYKVTIIPRGRALGVTMFLPEEDKYSYSHQSILDRICGLYGGRIAEEFIYGIKGVTTGASNDIERATELAYNMVTKWGLSEKLGPIKYGDETDEPFLGRSAGSSKQGISNDTAHEIDNEVKEILSGCYQLAKTILAENLEALHGMSKALMDYETLDAHQIDDIMAGGEPRAPKSSHDSKPKKPEDENKVGDTAEQN